MILNHLALWLSLAAPARPMPPPVLPPAMHSEAVVQIKLRDLFDVLPRKDAAEALAAILQRLVAIEERLRVIEERLRAQPTPLPPVGPAPGPLQERRR